MVLQGPDLHRLDEPGRAYGHQRRDLPEAGLSRLAGLTVGVLGVERTSTLTKPRSSIFIADNLASGVTLNVAASGLE